MKISANKLSLRIHSYSGLIIGLFLLVISITGIPLLFRDELDPVIYNELFSEQPLSSKLQLPTDSILARARAQFPDATIANIALPREDQQLYSVRLRQEGKSIQAFYRTDGTLNGTREEDSAFIRRLLELHRGFLLKDTGRTISFFIGSLFILSTLTGVYTYRRSLKRVFKQSFRRKSDGKISYPNLHTTLGTLALLTNLGWATTGVMMQWESVQRTFSSTPARKPVSSATSYTLPVSIDSILDKSAIDYQGFEAALVTLPASAKDPILLRGKMKDGNPLYGKYRTSVEYDQTGKLKKVNDPNTASLDKKIDAAKGPIHYGEYGNIALRSCYALFALLPGTLSVTGFIIWLRKRNKAKARV